MVVLGGGQFLLSEVSLYVEGRGNKCLNLKPPQKQMPIQSVPHTISLTFLTLKPHTISLKFSTLDPEKPQSLAPEA